MSLDGLENRADLARFIEDQLRTPGVLPPPSLPFDGLAFGEAEVEWPGGSNESDPLTIEHGLGAKPTGIQLTAQRTEHTSGYAVFTTVDEKELTIVAVDPFGEPEAHLQAVSWEVMV